MKPICLVASARTYSNYVFRYTREYNRKNFGIMWTHPNEFLIDNIEHKQWYLQECRNNGLEFSIKLMSSHVEEEWVRDFYKDWRIVKLVRKDTYRKCISYLFAIFTDYDAHYKNIVDAQNGITKTRFDKWHVEQSYWAMKRHETYLPEAEVWYSEEFNEEVDTPLISTEVIDYEDYIENLDEVKQWLRELDEKNNLLSAF